MANKGKQERGEPTYSYACNELGECININAKYLDDNYRKQHTFHCIDCGDEMYASLKDDKKCRYFAHKVGKCSYDSYLHTLAKHMLKDAFDAAKTFVLSYYVDVSCSQNGCPLRVNRCDCIEQEREVDLKKWYDRCELEKEVTGKDGTKYVADILLTSSKRITPPLLLEIFVTHECTPEKKASGLWIVELKIRKESNIERICKSGVIEESYDVRLYNFDRKKNKKSVIDIPRYVHYPSGISVMRHISCNTPAEIIDEKSDLEINALYNSTESNCFDESFIKLYVDQRYGLCGEIEEWNRLIPRIYRDIKLTAIKGEFPEDYVIMMYGPHKFFNFNKVFMLGHVNQFLEENNHPEHIMLRTFRGDYFSASVLEVAEQLHVFVDYEPEDWEKDGKCAGFRCVNRLLRGAHAAIIFYKENDKLCQYVVEKLTERNIPTKIVDMAQYPDTLNTAFFT